MTKTTLIEKFSKKFKTLVENIISRYQTGGLLPGDIVRFKEEALKDDAIVAKWPAKDACQEYIDLVMKGDLNLRVSAVKSIRPNTGQYYGSGQGSVTDAPADYFVDVVIEYAPGLWHSPMTVPIEVLERIDTENNLAPVPNSFRRPNNIGNDLGLEPEGTMAQDIDRNLRNQNIKIPYGNQWKDNIPGSRKF